MLESFIPGLEYAVEGVIEHGVLRVLALFDKPDPLNGPYFEESIYVTPSVASVETQKRIKQAIVDAVQALGLRHGPVHAECRVNARGVFVLEVAARPIGGLCARALRFLAHGGVVSLEELLLRHSLGESVNRYCRESAASAVMMIPIPQAGVYRRTEQVVSASRVPGVVDVVIQHVSVGNVLQGEVSGQTKKIDLLGKHRAESGFVPSSKMFGKGIDF